MTKTITLNDDYSSIIKKTIGIQKKIDAAVGKMGGQNLLIYAAGPHTLKLLECISFDGVNLRICDQKTNGKIEGIKIERPSKELFSWSDCILISSFFQQRSIYDYLLREGAEKSKIITLYDESDKFPFYKTEIELTATREDDIDLDHNPYTAFTTAGKGKTYEANVEHAFFDAVTKNYFLENIKKGDRVLDVGAGTGRLSIECKKAGAIVTAADTSADMLQVLIEKDPSIQTVVVDGVTLPFEDGSFDALVSCDAMVHFQNWREFVQEHARVVKSGGYIIYNMVNDDHLRQISANRDVRQNYVTGGRGRFASVTRQEIEDCCAKCGLALERMYPYGFFILTADSYGILSRSEMMQLETSYMSMCHNEKAASIIKRFENEIVRNLPEDYAESNMVVMRKI